jgi:type I restriction enzyme, S subunit
MLVDGLPVLGADGSVNGRTRFTKTEIGEIPEEWILATMAELAAAEKYSCIGGPFGSDLTSRDYVSSGVPVIRGHNLGDATRKFTDDGFVYVSEAKADALSRNLAYPGDLVFTQRGTLGQVGLIPLDFRFSRLVVSQSQMKISLNTSKADREFLYQYMTSPLALKLIQNRTIATGVPHINLDILKHFPVPLPPLPEQRKVAAILSSVDEAIQATQAVVEQTRRVKEGLLQELLTKGIGHTRFKQTEIGLVPAEWNVLELGKMLCLMDSGWSPLCPEVMAHEAEWAVLKTTAVVWDGYNPEAHKRLPDELSPRPEIEVKKGDVLVTRAGPRPRVGVVVHVKETRPRLMLSDKLIRLRTDPEKLHPGFLACCLSSASVQRYWIDRASGMADSQANISQQVVRTTLIPVPCLMEQLQIFRYFEVLATNICLNQGKLLSLLQVKAGLLQDLLTGKVRVGA